MKKNTILMLIFWGAASVIIAQPDQFYVKVNGMGCPSCAQGLDKKFRDVKGIKNLKVELETGLLTFSVPSENALSPEEVNNRVNKAGYTVVETKIVRATGREELWTKPKKSNSDPTTETFKVYGNCGMCKTRIEKAAQSLNGVSAADWDMATKMLKVTFDPAKVKVEEIHNKIAGVGHDTDKVKAKDEVYDTLHGCCKYDRT